MTTLIATVGSNPLPVVVSIRALNPDHLWLLYTDDVEGVTNCINNHLNRKLPNCEISQLEIKDHQKAKSIHATLGEIKEDWSSTSLNYTGGTKFIAVYVHSFWKEKGGRPEYASYLGSDGRLYFDDGRIMEEKDLPSLSLDEQCLLHLGKKPLHRRNDHYETNRLTLAKAIRQVVSYKGWVQYRRQVENSTNIPHVIGVDESLIQGIENDFLQGGKWLEVWFADQLEKNKR